MRFISAIFLSILLMACASGPSQKTANSGPPSKHFFGCFDESKRTWLVSVVGSKDPSGALSETLIPDYVGSSLVDQARARSYLNDLLQKKYANEETMAGTQFNVCMTRVATEKFETPKAIACYKEQRIIFELTALRQVKGVGIEEATQHLISTAPSPDGSTTSAIRRLAKDTYTMLKPGSEYAFSAAQFQVCMTSKP